MASISTLRAFPHTQVILTIEAAPAIAGISGSGDTSSYTAETRQPIAAHDQAPLSVTGTVLARTLSLSDVRFDKVAALQQAIASGTYRVSSDELAGRLIESLTA